ncbi:MAG: branched-chain amino acid ABC transporter permease [Oscillospiraceae bacterium]|nr:branched-chain amino acid ABC transporter permease [Oscillospiraceae bacterium]
MSTFFQTLIVGLRLGSIYALIALGYTMVYGIIRLINFAHGDFIMVGGYTVIFTIPLVLRLGAPAWVSVLAAVVVCALVGMSTELIAYRPVRKKGTNMTALITAIAMSLFLENLAQAIPVIGPNPKVSTQIFRAGGIRFGTVTMEYTTIFTLIISAVIMLVLYTFTQKTRLGRAMRCVSEDKAAATLMGINVNHTILLTFGIGSALAAVAALMYLAQYPKVYTTMGGLLGLKAFVSAVLGGIGIIPGAMLGGIVIGLVESFTTSYISSSMADTFVFLILIIVLVIKPAGILGKNVGEKV